jgi:hypothetical protein
MVDRSYFEQKFVVPEHRCPQYTASLIGTQITFLSDAPQWLIAGGDGKHREVDAAPYRICFMITVRPR